MSPVFGSIWKAGPKPAGAWIIAATALLAVLSGCPARTSRSAPGEAAERVRPAVEPSSPSFTLAPSAEGIPAFGQGKAFLVLVENTGPATASVRASWDGQTIPCLPQDGGRRWIGLGGVDRRARPATYSVTIRIQTTHGRETTLEGKLRVVPTAFTKDYLSVDPDKVVIPDEYMDWVEEDRRAFARAWKSPSPGMMWDGPFLRPVEGRITAEFGQQRVFNGQVKSVHGGVDLAAAQGRPVRAAAAGRVVLARECWIEGGTVVVDHGGGLFTYYCHLSGFEVAEGELVEKGRVVGLAGSTGRVTGPHLHWGCRVQGVKVDGLSLLELEPWLLEMQGYSSMPSK